MKGVKATSTHSFIYLYTSINKITFFHIKKIIRLRGTYKGSNIYIWYRKDKFIQYISGYFLHSLCKATTPFKLKSSFSLNLHRTASRTKNPSSPSSLFLQTNSYHESISKVLFMETRMLFKVIISTSLPFFDDTVGDCKIS